MVEHIPLVLAAGTGAPTIASSTLSLPSVSLGTAYAIRVSSELDGPGEGFGGRFWNLVSKTSPEVLPRHAGLVHVSYEDRYLITPLTCALLVEVLRALKHLYEQADRWAVQEFSVKTMQIVERGNNRFRDLWTSDWPDARSRDAALAAAFEYAGMSAAIDSRQKRELIHGRRLTLTFEDHKQVTVWLDQGLSYWTISRQQARTSLAAFAMRANIDEAAARLAEIEVSVEGHELATQMFVERG